MMGTFVKMNLVKLKIKSFGKKRISYSDVIYFLADQHDINSDDFKRRVKKYDFQKLRERQQQEQEN